jgi:hypothetical protein
MKYTEDDVGKEVEIVIEGVTVIDTVDVTYKPDATPIYGQQLSLCHIFARFSMLEPMLAWNGIIQEAQKDGA